ncbi:MAG: MFS transporter [Marinilabiliales bacterium]|nr:MAG: MFS transporter [Marinilabiliales bacterium]
MLPQILDIKSYFSRAATAFTALKARNYRLYLSGMLFSTIGTWIQVVAMSWLVYRLTGDVLLLGVVAFAGHIPSVIITPLAGVYADRMNRRKVIIATQIAMMVFAFILAFLVLSETIEVWHLIVLAILNGFASSADTPFRHAFVREMVDDQAQLQNAVALNSTLFNTARVIGPSIGGFLIALVGEGWCFAFNGVSFLAVVFSLLMMRITFVKKDAQKKSVIHDLAEGIKYSYKTIPIRYMLILVISTGLFCLPFQTFLPVYAKDLFSGGSELYGLMVGVYGVGALSGSVYLTSRKTVKTLPRVIMLAALIYTVCLLVFSMSDILALSLVALYIGGFGMITQYTSVNTMLQTVSDPDKVGRVISLYGMSFMTITPIGIIVLSALADIYNVRWVVFISVALSFIALIIYTSNYKRVLWILRKRFQDLF